MGPSTRLLGLYSGTVALAILGVGGHCTPPIGPVSPAILDAAFDDAGQCASVCTRLQAMSCPEGQPTPKGASCTEVCTTTINNGFSLNLNCVAQATSCAQVDNCYTAP